MGKHIYRFKDKCSCGKPFAYRLGKKGPWFWCWLCDGHAGGCGAKGQPTWKRCDCVSLEKR